MEESTEKIKEVKFDATDKEGLEEMFNNMVEKKTNLKLASVLPPVDSDGVLAASPAAPASSSKAKLGSGYSCHTLPSERDRDAELIKSWVKLYLGSESSSLTVLAYYIYIYTKRAFWPEFFGWHSFDSFCVGSHQVLQANYSARPDKAQGRHHHDD